MTLADVMIHLPDPMRSRAVLIGVADYEDVENWAPLPAVRNNVEELQALIADPEIWGLPEGNVATIIDPIAIKDTLESVHNAADEALDTVLIYYAGHGVPTHEDLLLTLSSTTTKNQNFNSVRFSVVRDIVRERSANHAVVILDCCFSGKAHSMSNIQSFMANQISVTSAFMLTSSSRDAISLAPVGERYTAFTGQLIDVLRSGMSEAGEFLSLRDVAKAVSIRLVDRRAPKPQTSQSGSGELLSLGRNRLWHPSGQTSIRADVERPRSVPSEDRVFPSESSSLSDSLIDAKSSNVVGAISGEDASSFSVAIPSSWIQGSGESASPVRAAKIDSGPRFRPSGSTSTILPSVARRDLPPAPRRPRRHPAPKRRMPPVARSRPVREVLSGLAAGVSMLVVVIVIILSFVLPYAVIVFGSLFEWFEGR